MPATKKGRGRAAANKVTKPESKPTTRRAAAKASAALEKDLARQALVEKTNTQPAKTTRGRKPKKAAEEEEADDHLATPPLSDEPAKTTRSRGRPRKDAATAVAVRNTPSEVLETQVDELMDMNAAEEELDQVEPLPTLSRFSAPPSAQHTHPYHVPTSAAKRSSSLLDGDTSLRRRLGHMIKKYEVLELRNRELRNVAVVEAEKNFDKLKKQSEERAWTSDELITSLKAEVAAQKQLAKQGRKSQQQLEASEGKVDSLQAQVTKLTTSLDEAKTEIKSLATKLTAARAAEAAAAAQVQAATARVPGSAMKKKASGNGARGVDSAQVQMTQTTKMKENLYSDLTGLVLTGVRRDGAEDVYDCIQTGRNGTLHFKLAVANENSGEIMDKTGFVYKPQLDERRDDKLIGLLPGYLVEDITFSRSQAAIFYSRVLKSLTEKLE